MTLQALQQAAYQPVEHRPGVGLDKALNQASENFRQISESLNSGDVAGARTALADVQKILFGAGAIGSANSLQTDLGSLGKNISSGNAAEAQADLQKLQGDLQLAVHGAKGPGLPVRLPGGYQLGVNAAKTVGGWLA